jgi:hypothetical protein
MTKKYLKIAILLSLCGLISMLSFQQLSAQVFASTAQDAQNIKFLSVSGLRSWFSNLGAEIEYGRRDRTANVGVDQIDGLCWPNEYHLRMKGVKVSKGLWIGALNFDDPVANQTFLHKVVSAGPRKTYAGTEIFTDDFFLYGKSARPYVTVNGDTSGSTLSGEDFVDIVDNSVPADRVLYSTFHTSMCISVTRKILSFTQQYNNNYYIEDYTFKNTGFYDRSGKTKSQTLNGVYFYLFNRTSLAGESYTGISTNTGWFPTGTSWGRNTITDAVGQDASKTLPPPNDFRACIQYWGPANGSTVETTFGAAADVGLPGPGATNVWILAGPQFSGMVTVHADKSAADNSDDPGQPATNYFVGCDNEPGPGQYIESNNAAKYAMMSYGKPDVTMADDIGRDPIGGWPTGIANTYSASNPLLGTNDAGGYAAGLGYGPYTMNFGDSIHIVVAECIAGIDRSKALEVAQNWFSSNTAQMTLPAGYAAVSGKTTTTNRDEYKNAWVFSGKDSLFQTFRRAIANYKSGYAIPQPPPPPDSFNVSNGNDILITWSKSAESAPHFNGYRLYRAESRPDTSYTKIMECDRTNIVNSYLDKDAKLGFNYYYYIQSKDDGTTNPGDASLNIPAGEPLVSGKYYTMTINPASRLKSLGTPTASDTSITTIQFAPDSISTKYVLPIAVSMDVKTDTLNVFSTKDSLNHWIVQNWSNDVRIKTTRLSDTSYTVLKDLKPISAKHLARQDTIAFNTPPLDTISVRIYNSYTGKFLEDGTRKKFVLPTTLADTTGTQVHWFEVLVNGVRQIPSSYTIDPDTLTGGRVRATHQLLRDTISFLRMPPKGDSVLIKIHSINYNSGQPPTVKINTLAGIRIVPNPWNIRSRKIQYGNSDLTRDQLEFFNLPPYCKISIFTENGDLVTTINHTSTAANPNAQEPWNLTTSSRQIVVSGIYIAYFEVTKDALGFRNGDHIIKKFVVIR